MLNIQAQPQVSPQQQVNFKGREDEGYERRYVSTDDDYDNYDSFDRDSIESERDEKLNNINQSKSDLEDLADELDKNGGKVGQGASKLVRYGATALGIVGSFVAAKFSSRLAINTLKSFGKSQGAKTVMEGLKSAKEPLTKAFESTSKLVKSALKNPKIQENIDKVVNSNVGKKVSEFLANEKVAKVLEPLKNTLKSVKDFKFDGNKAQSWAENIMAGTTTGSVIVDDIAGRNKHKSNMDLASGV